MTTQWDRTLLVPAKAGPPKLLLNNTSGGTGLGGSEQIVGNTPPRWAMKFSNIALNGPAKIRKWNELAGLLQGRLGTLLIPIFDKQRVDGAPVVHMSGTAVAGATSCNLKLDNNTGVLYPGQHFSVAERLYRLTTIDAGAPGTGYVVYAVTLTPPLRETIANNTVLEFSDPWFRVRLASDDEMDAELDAFRFDQPSVSFLEDA